MKQLGPPDDFIGQCAECGSTYKFTATDFDTDRFKVSGTWWGDDAVVKPLKYVKCPFCSKNMFQADMERTPGEATS